MRSDANFIYKYAIEASLPDPVVRAGLEKFRLPSGRLILVAIGKAAYTMAKCAKDILGDRVDAGIIITKYGHSGKDIDGIKICEAGHPIPDENGVRATEAALEMTSSLTKDDAVLFLVSGGGSALFESPMCSLGELSALTESLLSSGADIEEINTVRKHVSKVKGGRFAEHVYPARIFSIILSDVIGDRIDAIASGPAVPDLSTSEEARAVLNKYKIKASKEILEALSYETPKSISGAEHFVGGSVTQLCLAAKEAAEKRGYKTEIISTEERGVARALGKRIAEIAAQKCYTDAPLAIIIGGETVVKVKGDGLGGRNQEIALTASFFIAGMNNIAIFSVASDGTDGPTEAAGGFVDGESFIKMEAVGAKPVSSLENNDSYTALKSIDGLIITGPTGTNVNDLSVALIRPIDLSKKRERRFSNLERVMNFGLCPKEK